MNREKQKKILKSLCIAATTLVLLVAILTGLQARSMLHFSPAGERTLPAEQLSITQKFFIGLSGISIPKSKQKLQPEKFGLKVSVERFQSFDGLMLEAWMISPPSPKGLVLMLHGYTDEKSSLLAEARSFHDLGYGTLLLDFRGSGNSEGLDTTVGYREAEDVMKAYEYLQARSNSLPIIIYGRSMGAVAALRASSALNIQPAKLILECPFDSMLNTVRRRFEIMKLPAFPLAEMIVAWGSILSGFNGFSHNPVEYAAAVTIPTLLISGKLDSRVTPEDANRIFLSLSGPKKFLLYDAGHNDLFTASPERWKSDVAAFLE